MDFKKTIEQFEAILSECRELFTHKFKDYGASWRVMRPTAITDQIYIKAQRIRSVQEKKENKVGEALKSEFIGIVNYAIMGLVQLEKGYSDHPIEVKDTLLQWYDGYAQVAKELMFSKNHDYGEAWRSMRVSSITDIILQKVFRTKQIEDNLGTTKVSEGIDANYLDILNYAVFALIKISEGSNAME